VSHKNKLSEEKSPYLLQHKDNPVHWFAWGEDAFALAKKENKPIFLSIGYSTCYWCHVMEKDSFEKEEVADVLNANFISIKIDREERPDIDSIYMDYVVASTGHGGWPMSVILTPDLKPFFGGTFFYKEQFISLLQQITAAWQNSQQDIQDSAEKIVAYLRTKEAQSNPIELNNTIFQHVLEQLAGSFDERWGGFGQKPKFPQADRIALLLRISRSWDSEDALLMAVKTLEQMARGGIYDHLGGGFHRYSTDSMWLAPHFEKMLYDNALLSCVYLEAFQLTKKQIFADVAARTLDYVLSDMTAPSGGFYSAEDAGDVGKEGEYYVWTANELKDLLTPEEFAVAEEVYRVSSNGNFEHQTNILHLRESVDWSAKQDALVLSLEKKLLNARKQRKAPHKDDKILTEWNGMMISALAFGARVLGDSRYLKAAQKAAHFIKASLCSNDKLQRRFRDGEANFTAYLNDYAFLIQGLLSLYESDFDKNWLDWAAQLQQQQDSLFWDETGKGYFFTDNSDSSVIIRQREFSDGASPSGNSISMLNLLRLHGFTYEEHYLARAKETINAASQFISRYPSAASSALCALDYALDSAKEVAIVSNDSLKDATPILEKFWQLFLPNQVLAFGSPAGYEDSSAAPLLRGKALLNGKTTFYVCRHGSCELPTNDLVVALKQINN